MQRLMINIIIIIIIVINNKIKGYIKLWGNENTLESKFFFFFLILSIKILMS